MRGEKQFVISSTHARYLYIKSLMLWGTIQLWTMISSMYHLWQMLTDTVHVIYAAPKWHNIISDEPIGD